MRFCTNCGSQVPDSSKFCTECGEKLPPLTPAPPVYEPDTPAAPPADIPGEREYSIPAAPVVEPLSVPAYNAAEDIPSPPPPESEPESVPQPPPPPPAEPEPIEPPPPPPPPPAEPARPQSAAHTAEKKSGNKKLFLFGGIGLALVLVIVLLVVLLGGGGGDDPNLGVYNAVSCESSGISLGCEGEWIELKAKGKAELLLLGESYSAKWSLDGSSFLLTQSGDEFEGSLKDGVLSLDFAGLLYTYEKEGYTAPAAPAEPAEPAEPTQPTEPTEPDKGGKGDKPATPESTPPAAEPIDSPYAWWEGDWYGWWIVQSASGAYEDWQDYFWDAYANVELGEGDTGHMDMWDPDTHRDSPLASMEVYFGPGVSEYGTMRVESGYFMDYEFEHADWAADPGAMGFEIEDMIWIDFDYVDPANSDDTMDIYIFLRPWGCSWEDVKGGDDGSWPYSDMMPMYYDDWYKPLIDRGCALPDSYVEGIEILGGGSNLGSGEVLASGHWDECIIEVVGAESFVDYEGKDAVRVYFDYTNTGTEASYAYEYLSLNVSQDDYRLYSTSSAWDKVPPEDGNAYLALRPGMSIRCIAEYPLKLSGGTFVMEFVNFWDESRSFTLELDPQALPGRPPQWEEEFIGSPAWLVGVPDSGKVGDHSVSIDHVEIVEGYNSDEVFKVVLNFTNNSDSATYFSWALNYRAFQNGIELTTDYPSDAAETDADSMLYEEVQPGDTVQVAVCYALRNQQSPVEFEVFDYWSGNKVGNVFELTWGG